MANLVPRLYPPRCSPASRCTSRCEATSTGAWRKPYLELKLGSGLNATFNLNTRADYTQTVPAKPAHHDRGGSRVTRLHPQRHPRRPADPACQRRPARSSQMSSTTPPSYSSTRARSSGLRHSPADLGCTHHPSSTSSLAWLLDHHTHAEIAAILNAPSARPARRGPERCQQIVEQRDRGVRSMAARAP